MPFKYSLLPRTSFEYLSISLSAKLSSRATTGSEVNTFLTSFLDTFKAGSLERRLRKSSRPSSSFLRLRIYSFVSTSVDLMTSKTSLSAISLSFFELCEFKSTFWPLRIEAN